MASANNDNVARHRDDDDDDVNEASRPDFRFAQIQHEQQRPTVNVDVVDDRKLPAVQPNGWRPRELKSLPAFYPLEKSSRLVEDDTVTEIAGRLSEVLRKLSIQAIYDNDTAMLFAEKNVEMHISLWQAETGILVEVQRRKGDSMIYHGYANAILDAAMGLMENSPRINLHSKKVQRMLDVHMTNSNKQEHEHAVCAIEIAHGLLTKDRMDARVLGLESLCLLTDGKKTTKLTSLLTSHVVLLGSTNHVHIPGVEYLDEGPFEEIRESILSLVQFSKIGEDEGDVDHLSQLHNLALAVLANALDCVENFEAYEDTPERPRLRTASSSDVANEFLNTSKDISKKELLDTLIKELSTASSKPHDATLSASCIHSLCKSSESALSRAKELGAKEIVRSALEVGVKTHQKLETTCENLSQVLENQTEQDDGGL